MRPILRPFLVAFLTICATQAFLACGGLSEDNADNNNAVAQVTPEIPSSSQMAARLAATSTAWQLQFEKPATIAETLRILGSQNEAVEEILFQLPNGGMAGGGSVKLGNVQNTLQQAGNNFRKMSAELVYPTDKQLAENAKDSDEAARNIASMRQVRADDEANLRYVETHGVPITAVRFKVLPKQEQTFLARWSTPASAGQTRFTIVHPMTGRAINPVTR